MDTSATVAPPQDDYVIEPPAQQGASASADDYQIEIPHDSQQQGPVNPYATAQSGPPVGMASSGVQSPIAGTGPASLAPRAPSAPPSPITPFVQAHPRLGTFLPDPTTPKYQQLSHDIAADQAQQSEDEIGAAKDVSGISGAETLGSGLRGVFTPTAGETRAAQPGATPMTTEETDAANKQMITSLTKTIAGGGQIAMVLGAPEVGAIFRNALGGAGISAADQLAARVTMFKIAKQMATGTVASVGGGAIAHELKVSPEAENLVRTGFFFIPGVLGSALAVNEHLGPISEDTAGYSAETKGGKFGVGVKQSPEGTEVRAGIKGVGSVGVGPRGVTVERPGGPQLPGGEGEAPTSSPAGPPTPPAPPSAPEVQASAQIAEVTRLAATARGTQVQAEQLTGSLPPPPPKPKIPSPAGMDDGHLSQQTVETAGQVIQSLPAQARPKAILEAVGTLAKWMFGQRTVLGPDDQVVNVDSQKSAQTEAVKIINAEMEKQKTQAEDAADEKKKNLATAQEERDEAITPTEKKESTGNTPAVPIPKSPQVDRARAAIQGAPADATADHFDQIIRKTALVTTPVRKALVEEEVNRRANLQEDQAQTAMDGQPATPGQSRIELQKWADGVKNGEHPFVHVPAKSDFVPAGVDGLTKTKVNGAGAFGGTYYHDPEVSAADIRKAARDKKDPQAALDAIVANWKGGGEPVELSPEEVAEPKSAEAEFTEDYNRSPRLYEDAIRHIPEGGRIPSREELRDAYNEAYQRGYKGMLGDFASDLGAGTLPTRFQKQPGEKNPSPQERISKAESEIMRKYPPLTVLDIQTQATTAGLSDEQYAEKLEEFLNSKPKPLTLTPEAATGLKQIVEAAKADDPAATLDTILRHPADGKIITQALVNDGIITNSDTDVNPATSLLTTRARTKVGDALLSSVFSPEVVEAAPPFVREKLLGSMGAIGSIAETSPEWNIKPALEKAITEYGNAFKGADTEEYGEVVDRLIQLLDGPVDAMRKAFSNYAVSASSPGENPNPVLDFNVAFGTELTAEQFAEGMKATKASSPTAVTTREESLPSTPKPLAKGDQVIYRTTKGKERTGEVAWTDGKKVRITDNGSTVNKSVDDVKLASVVPADTTGEASLVDHLHLAFSDGRGPKDYNGLKKLVTQFDGTEPTQLRMKEAQEAYEAMLNRVASEIVLKNEGGSRETFSRMVNLYEKQPNLSIRTSTSIDNQAYSTPLPLAFVADRFAGIDFKSTVYEPTAGNGALLIAANPELTRANEFNPARAATLKAEGFSVTTNDATTWGPAERVDAIVANPPFGKLPALIKYDGYSIVKLDHLIAVKALSVMKDKGRAAIILGAGDRENAGEVTNAAKPFFNYIYSHYNVVSDFELDGDLYARQGASFPVRVIAIDGRTRTAKVSPVAEDIQRLKTWEEVYAKASEHLGSNLEGRQRSDDVAGSAGELQTDTSAVPRPTGEPTEQGDSGRPSEVAGRDWGDGQPLRQLRPIRHTGGVPSPPVGSPDIATRPDGDVALSDRLAEGQPAPRIVRRESAEPNGRSANAALANVNALADESNQFQGTYVPRSEKKDVSVMAPKGLIGPMHSAMDMIAKDVGDLDEFVTNELGYPSLDELHAAFMGIQTDAIAAAIYQMKRGKAIIVGDQTGRGKGRIAAAMIRWAELHGHLPIFMSEKATLFSDMYRDLTAIGSGDTIAPLLVNSDASITNQVTGQKMYQNNGAMRPVLDRIRETGQLPPGRNALFLTYSQINTDNRQQLTLHRLAPNAVFVLDESHNAGGASATGAFISEVTGKSKGVVFLSATWAKRPDNLPVYAGKTDISVAIPDKDKVVDAIAAGGAPLQSVMTNQLAQTGQFVRRESSFDGIDIKNAVDEDNRLQHEKISDKVTEVLRAIMDADSAYHNLDFARILKDAKKAGKSANSKQIQVSHMEFSSIVHNMVKQLLLALKAKDSADRIIASIEDGERPIYALENTMGSFLSSYVEGNNLSEGDSLKDLTYSKISDRALTRTRYYKQTDEMGNESRIEVPLDDLSPEVRAKYDAAQALIDNLNVDLPVSPIDYIRDRVEKAGYKIAEITGRDWRIDYSGDTPKLAKVPGIERKDRVNTAMQYNNGQLDALIINKSASAGISLHASADFLDQRPRHMILGQAAGDVNVVMQILGRVNRTGQLILPRYTFLSAALPAEMRPAIVLAKKMKSLNANVSSNTRSATSVKAVDMFNKYGDKIVSQYLLDNPEMERLLGVPIDVDTKGEPSANEGKAMKATGHSALLTVKQQQQFMDAITEAYTNYIDFLDETGQNDLEPVTYDYDARETHKERMYQGTDPSSPFGQDAHYGEYSIKRQGKSFTPEEVHAKLAETFGPEMMKLAPYQRDTEFARGLAAHFEELYKPYYDTLMTQGAMEKASAMRGFGRSLLNEYRVGSAFSVEINGDVAHAVVTNIEGSKKTSGNPYAPSSLQFTLAINSPLRSIKVPGSQISKITTANLGRNADINHLFKDVFGDSRQKAKIITGNLLGAYGELKAGVKGRIISFTMADGTTQLGIQMPTKFDVKTDISDTYAMRSPEAAREFLSGNGRSLQSSGQEIGVFSNPDGGLNLRTKVSKATSGKFFLDPRLRELVVGADFVSSGGLMKATVKDGMELDALEVIMGKIALYAPSTEIQAARKLDEKMQGGGSPKKSSLRKAMGDGEEGFAEIGMLVPPSIARLAEKVGNYLRRAVPATWGELSKATGVAVKTPKAIGYEIASVLYPAMLADADARDIMGRALGEPALELFKARLFLDGIDKMFEGMPEKDWVEFVDRIQSQKEQPTPDLQKAADMLKSVMEGQRMAEQAAVNLGRKKSDRIELQDRAGYFPNRYSKPPGDKPQTTEAEQMARIFAKRPFAGPKTFTKQQKYTLKDAVADGAVPLGNPVRMVLRRLQEGAKFVAAQQALWNGRQTGLIVYKSARAKMPANFVKMQDNIARVFRPVETAEGGTVFVQGGEWVIDKDFGRIFNNYLSQDLIRNSTVGNGFVQLKTSSTAFKMGVSAFHYGTVTFWGLAEGLHSGLDEFYNQGVRGLDPEKMAAGAKRAATFLINPVARVVGGDRIIKYLKSPDDFLGTAAGEKLARDYPDLPELLRLVFAGGFRPGFNEDFPENSPMGIGKDFAAGRLVSGTMKAIPFAARAIAYPLFQYIIPRLKLMANVQMLSQKLEQYSQAIANGDVTPETVARNVVAANENSFGEFNYENNYWNNTVKTAMQLAFLAPGWKEGTWRGLGQAAKEVFSESYGDHFYEKVEAEGKADDWAHKYAAKLPQLGVNTGRMIAAFIVATAIATTLEKLLTGKWIWEEIASDMKGDGLNVLQASELEALHPRTGKYDQHGHPVRFNLPTDLRDYEHAVLAPASYAYNSLAPWLTGIINTMKNRDALGNYVYNPADDQFLQFKQGLYYNLMQSYQPITASSYLYKGQQDSTTKAERTLGVIGGAPKGYDSSRSVARAEELRETHDPRVPLTPEQQSEKDMLKNAPPTRYQAKYALRTRNLTELDKIVQSLSYTDAKDVYDHATADEKRDLLPILRKKQAEAVRKALRR
jgi:C-terminal domain on Strawberry notch homologue/P-loop containing NTP hydrolase pore-1